MSNDFNLKKSTDYSTYEKNFVAVTPAGTFSLVRKAYVPLLPQIVGKVIHWILHPDQRISAVRDAFSRLQADGKTLKEQLNLYVHLRNFNELIDKHNRTALFWTKVALLDLSPFEEKIKQSLARHVNYSVETKSLADHAQEIEAARKVLKCTACEGKLSTKLTVLYTEVASTCQMQDRLLRARIYKELDELENVAQWDLSHVALFHNELPAVLQIFAKDDNLWSNLAADHTKMQQGALQKTEVAVQKELSGIMTQIDQLKAKIDNAPARANVGMFCEQINALPNFKEKLASLGKFLPREGAVREQINRALPNYEFLKKLAALYPAHKQALDTFLQEASVEIKAREAAFETYGQVSSSLSFLEQSEFIKFVCENYKTGHHPFYIDNIRQTSDFYDIRSLCRQAGELLTLPISAAEIEQMSEDARTRYLKKLDDLLKDQFQAQRLTTVPKLAAKCQALRHEVLKTWEPYRPKAA